ncbi:hypothetical protein ANANG_G00031860 [Anguilla anguilla]|uniref:Uncharacterized protein n=1 Tax=Anguilla anguilla TaxID=7936 RepID=A0A9D3MSH1_ANGAN|nr:hypothetical protein ANANG_G00031860 [Anguilla anguilla]
MGQRNLLISHHVIWLFPIVLLFLSLGCIYFILLIDLAIQESLSHPKNYLLIPTFHMHLVIKMGLWNLSNLLNSYYLFCYMYFGVNQFGSHINPKLFIFMYNVVLNHPQSNQFFILHALFLFLVFMEKAFEYVRKTQWMILVSSISSHFVNI